MAAKGLLVRPERLTLRGLREAPVKVWNMARIYGLVNMTIKSFEIDGVAWLMYRIGKGMWIMGNS